MSDVERLKVSVKTVVTNAAGKETAGAELFLGEMKLEDVKIVEKVLLERIPQIFMGLLAKY